MSKSKSYAQQIDNVQVMLAGLKANTSALEKRGITAEFITGLETTLNNTIAKNNEQEKFKADLKASTVALNGLLTRLKNSMSEATTVIKLEIPQPQWKEFGIKARR
jgi:hypothetical protein